MSPEQVFQACPRPRYIGLITSLAWPGNAMVFPDISYKQLLDFCAFAATVNDPAPDKWQKMYRWIYRKIPRNTENCAFQNKI